MAGHISFPDKQ